MNIKTFRLLVSFLPLVVLQGTASAAVCSNPGIRSDLGESQEIKYTGALAQALCDQAAALNNPVKIYEYVRNTYEYALYQGVRSGSVNTFMGQRGNDVDQAATLIAMFRSRGWPARYAVGTVRVGANDLMNWLNVTNLDLAVHLLTDQGIQNVTLSADRATVDFEHVWVEVQLPYGNYRGAGTEFGTTNCSATPTQCQWISLDPSFKLRQYRGTAVDLYNTINFDYTAYYNAILSNDETRMNKNPLAIYEEQFLAYLRNTAGYSGKTLEDVINAGTILQLDDQVLPSSLPYSVTGTVRRYNTMAEHDAAVPAAEAKVWNKYLTISVFTQKKNSYGNFVYDAYDQPVPDQLLINNKQFALADLTTQQLTLTFDSATASCPGVCAVLRLNQAVVPLGTQPSIGLNDPVILKLTLDGSPANAQPIQAVYDNLTVVGGYYLIGSGGESSNWSQVHRAADQLLAANRQYPVVNNATGVPYLDANGNGVYDSAVDTTPLLDDTVAMDALTGGLMYTAMSQYFARFRDSIARLDGLNHVKSPIDGFVGVVSSLHEVEYVDGTAFAVMPGGLLIDMKGQRLNGSWRTDQASLPANKHFELLGHVMSSLEHEIWQELTGYDAVSTVRGIQMALTQPGAQLTNPKKIGTTDTLPAEYAKFGFGRDPELIQTAYDSNDLFFDYQHNYIAWTLSQASKDYYAHWGNRDFSFEIIKKAVTTANSSLRKSRYPYFYYSNANNSFADWLDCYQARHNYLYYTLPSTAYGTISGCNGTVYEGYAYNSNPAISLWHQIKSEFQNWFLPAANTAFPYAKNYLTTTGYDGYFENGGYYSEIFVPSDYLYRSFRYLPPAIHSAGTVLAIRDNLYLNLPSGYGLEYVIPNQKTATEFNSFSVYIAKQYQGSNLTSQSFIIQNAGGGYVDGRTALQPATTLNGVSNVLPTFNNAVFTDQELVSQVNNDVIRTPSTADPVSTVTGNNYHDETDMMIKGRGLHYTFTRTYNSGPASTKADGPLGYGWTHAYNLKLTSNDYGNCPNCAAGTGAGQSPVNGNNRTSSITYTDERGGEHLYLINESSFAVTPPAGEFDTLALNTPVAGQYTLTFRNGVKYVFQDPTHVATTSELKVTPNKTARLIQIADPYDNQLNFGYTGNNLTSISDNLGLTGRTGLSLTYYPGSPHIKDISDWTGRKWSYGYDSKGNLTSVTDPLTNTVTYTYVSGTHHLQDVILSENRGTAANPTYTKTTFEYYRNGKTFNYTNALGHTEVLDYDLYRRSARVTDPRGGIRSYDYDGNGQMIKLTEPDAAVLLFNNNDLGLRYRKFDALGYATMYSYRTDRAFYDAANAATFGSDSGGNVTRERDALNQDIDTTYGPSDQVASVKDKRGITMTTGYYTAAGACAMVGKPKELRLSTLSGATNVLLKEFCWNADGTLASLTEYIEPGNAGRARVTAYTYETDSNGLNVSDVDVTGSGETLHTHATYDNLGRKLTETLYRRTSATDPTPLALTTTYEYDALDRLVKVTDPKDDVRETVYDANGQVALEKVWHKQPDGSYVIRTVATHQYDAADRRIATTDVLNHTTQFAYDAAGNLTQVTDANGHTTRYGYDAMNRRTAVIDANGHRTATKYNLRGDVVAVVNANGETVKSEYDRLGRLTKTVDPLGDETRFQYDANGNLVCRIDANGVAGLQPVNADGCTESRRYDERNRLIQTKDAQDAVTAYVYDLLGNRTTVTDAENRTTTFRYDDLGRLVEVVDPLIETPADRTQTYLYDEAGNLIEETDRKGQVTRHTYDALNRKVRSDYLADNSVETYTYDAFGDLVQVQNSAVTYSYTYTARHQLQSKTDSRLYVNNTLRWTYDPVGNLATKTDYQGQVTTYQYDLTDRLMAEANPDYLQVSYHYDGAGRLLDRILSNGAHTRYSWDAAGHLTQLSNTTVTGQVINDTSYTRDRVGNLLLQTEAPGTGQPAGTTTYTYDPLYRLLTADYPGTQNDEAFSYDKVGNRKTHTQGALVPNAGTRYSAYDAGNRLQNIRTGGATGPIEASFTYDDNGSLLTETGPRAKTLTWDPRNRPKAINSNTFTYDPSGYRIGKTDSRGARTYLLEGEHLEAIYGNPFPSRADATYFRGSVIDEIVNGYQRDSAGNWVNTTYHHDALQSVLGQSGHTGTVLATQRYGAFGNLIAANGSSNNRLKYTGREEDGDTSLYYYRARYYDPAVGRFLSEDPLGFESGDVNFYAYVGNNPVNANDPSGHVANFAAGALVNVLVGGVIRGATGGSVFDGGAIATDLGVGAATSGLGALAQIRHTSALLNAARLEGRVIGNAQSTGTFLHAAASEQQAVNLLNQGADRVLFDRGLSTVTGLKGAFSPNIRPDVSAVFNNGSLRLVEVASKTQTVAQMDAKLGEALIQLDKLGLTASKDVVRARSFASPFGGKIGASMLNMDSFGAGITFGSQAIYQGGNNFSALQSSFANGGFVLYPNKSNTNMMQSVYSK